MLYTILSTVKIATLPVLIVLMTGGLSEHAHAWFPESTMETDILMTLDTLEPFDDEAECLIIS